MAGERIPVTPNQIVDAALQVTAREGLEAASLRRVAEAAGTSKSSILHHFGSAAGLRRSMVVRIGQLYQEIVVRAAAEAPGADIVSKGPHILNRVFAEEQREFHLAVQELMTAAARDPAMAAEAKTAFERAVWMITVLLGPPLDSALPTAQAIVATAQGYLNLWMWSGDEEPKAFRDAALDATAALLSLHTPT
jgi:AcrR family transcriptional regulator